MKNSFSKIATFIKKHKIWSSLILIVLVVVGIYTYRSLTSTVGETRYILGTVERGAIISSVSGSGQVSTSDQIDIKPKASGDITWVGVSAGDTVRAGQALAYIDATDAKRAVVDSEQSLAQAKLQFQKDSAQAPIDYQKAIEGLDDAKKSLATTFNDTFNVVSDAYLALPTVMTGAQGIIYGTDLSINKTQTNISVINNSFSSSDSAYEIIKPISDIAERDYTVARTEYDQSLVSYKLLTRYSNNSELEKNLTDSIKTTTSIAQALQSLLNFLDATIDQTAQRSLATDSKITTMRLSAETYLSTANSRLSSLLSQQQAIDADKRTIRDDERSLTILRIGNPDGNNPISLQSSAYSLTTQENNLRKLRDDLANYAITAPFAGTVASVNLKKFDTVGTGTAVATLVTNQKIAELSLNEVDAAKVKVGNKAILTFDAIENLTLTGSVASIDTVGTVSQGVVSYVVKIAFDSQNVQIKSGMTVNASIQTEVKQDVLAVPTSAVKTQNGVSYVQVFATPFTDAGGTQGVISNAAPEQIEVVTGISDDSKVEIVSGLTEGQQIITRTISGTATAAKTTTTSTNRNTGFGGSGIRL
ncbi:MAG: HlyD family efflux transporter periplasmic adaptor subunit [Candidatus Paceibacterota bacterium]|jgi:HlyD family secretion protein